MTSPENLPNRPDSGSSTLEQQLRRVLAPRYELEAKIGEGGMGIVYRASDTRLKRSVAIKLLPPDLAYRPEIRSRFLREAETAAQLNHPNIVPIYTVEEADNLVFFIMGYVNGENLAQHLRLCGPMPAEETRRVLREVAEALAYAHVRGVIHRDIKPDNILLAAESDGSPRRAIVTDFGIARALSDNTDTRLTTTGVPIGTPAYMSPEQCAGEQALDGRSDIYSIGAVGYQLLCGAPPFVAASTPAMYVKQLTGVPQPLEERCVVPQDLNATIMRCLAKDPAYRFASAQHLLAALNGDLVGGTMPVKASYGDVVRHDVSPDPDPANSSSHDLTRWEAAPVRQYRKKLVTYFMANAAIIPASIVWSHGLIWISMLWGVGLVSKYGKLWSSGYDWRDVFRRSRDTLFVDVVGETIDTTKALLDPEKRTVARERLRARLRREPGLLAPSPPDASSVVRPTTGHAPGRAPGRALGATAESSLPVQEEAWLPRTQGMQRQFAQAQPQQFSPVQEAALARDDIRRLVKALSATDRSMLPDVVKSADALYARTALLAANVDELDRAEVPGAGQGTAQELVQELAQLESELASEVTADTSSHHEAQRERRGRRLAQLRRQQASLSDLRDRREQAARHLDQCLSAMRSMRLDLLRLRAGDRSHESVTLLAEQAMQLGREVDAVLYARDEIGRLMDGA